VYCPLCPGKAEKYIGPARTKMLGVKLTLPKIERFRCIVCHEEFYDMKQAAEYGRLCRRQYKIQTSLTGADLARIRQLRLKISQADLEEKLGLGSKVVVRWENNKVRLPGPVNALFKILESNPRLLKLL
jgi:putative zinc finger/helix-turn-helix YgiT family protein